MSGTLFVVATPIGNLEDITLRALRVLREVSLVAAEDTRRTSKLLAHYEIRKPLISVREHSERRELPGLLTRLARGESIALVSDAGTPGIADPGATVVREVRRAGYPVVPIPGPSAIMAALSVSGLEIDEFVFKGFPPPGGASRDRWFDDLAGERRAVVIYESPHRIRRTIADCRASLGNRQILMFRELTKIYEGLVLLPNEHASVPAPELGEYTLLVSNQSDSTSNAITTFDAEKAATLFGQLTNIGLFDDDAAVSITAHLLSLSPTSVRKAVKKARYASKRALIPGP